VIADNVTAANTAGRKHDDSNAVRQIAGTSRVLRDGSITATVNGFTGNDWLYDKSA
jgi:hypothetical protein